MNSLPASIEGHRVQARATDSVVRGTVHWAPLKSLWFLGMLAGAVLGGLATISVGAVTLFVVSTAIVLLLGHSLGSHRKLIHDSYQCPKWLEYLLVYCGVQVGLAGPLGLLRQHELRDYAQRLPTCHDYLRHGRAPWVDAWWQLNCELQLEAPPPIRIEPRIAEDRFYRFLERTWMAQHVPWAVLFFAWGGWGYVFWGVCARVTAGVFGHWLIGYFAHNRGGMRYEVQGAAVQGRNIKLTSLLTMGESWHNNHHAYPGSSRLGIHAGEWDPGWWTLMLLRRVGLVWAVRLPQDLPQRAELVVLDAGGEVAAAAAPATTLVAAWRIARTGLRARVVWPGSIVSPRALARVAGSDVELARERRCRRFEVQMGEARLLGLPAVWVLIARRHMLARFATATLLPIAIAAERFRRWLDTDYALR